MIKPYMRVLPLSPVFINGIGVISDQDSERMADKFEFVSADDKKQLENAKASFEAGLKAINERLEFLDLPPIGSLWHGKNFPSYYVRVVDIDQGIVIYVKHYVDDDKIFESYAKEIPWFKSNYPTEYTKKTPCDC